MDRAAGLVARLATAWRGSGWQSLADLIWSGGLAPLLLLLALLVTGLSYQSPVQGREALTASPTPLRLSGVYPPEPSVSGLQRWTGPWARIRVPGVGSAPQTVRLHFFGGAQPDPARTLQIGTPDQTLAVYPVRPYWQTVQLYLPPGSADPRTGDLTLQFEIIPFQLPTDERELGISLRWIEIRAMEAAPQWPPWLLTLQLGLGLLLSLWTLRLLGFGARQLVLPLGLALLLAGALLAGWPGNQLGLRMQMALGLEVLMQVLPLALLLALGLRWLPMPIRPLVGSLPTAALLRLAVVLTFSLRLAGLIHPQFIPIDHGLRANQLLLIADGREFLVRERLEQQYEWGTRDPVPYSLLTYYMLLPLTLVYRSVPELVEAVKLVTVLCEATIPLLLALLLRGGPQRDAAAAWAGLVYALLPVGYLKFHDGSFPTTLGVWLTLIALVALRHLVTLAPSFGGSEPPPSRHTLLVRSALTTLGLALAIGAYVTHIAFVPFLSGMLALGVVTLGAQGTARRLAPWLFGSLALALLISWIMVYGSYTMTLIERTIPSYLGLIVREGSVGRDSDAFFGTPINTFPQHLAAHFRVWPVLIATAALAILLFSWRSRFATQLGLAYATFMLATSLAERWFGLWNKHMVFVAPGVALLAGLGLAWLGRRGRAGRLLVTLLLLFLAWEVVIAWGNRVLWYDLPPTAL
ncbi:MAG: hypothetical protein AB4911_21175 [Oscillochloridaceae bacterium umkhey_bin13]